MVLTNGGHVILSHTSHEARVTPVHLLGSITIARDSHGYNLHRSRVHHGALRGRMRRQEVNLLLVGPFPTVFSG